MKGMLAVLSWRDRTVLADMLTVAGVASRQGFDIVPIVQDYPVSYARNQAVSAMLQGSYDVLWFMDADTIPVSVDQVCAELAKRVVDTGISHAPYPFWDREEREWKWSTGRFSVDGHATFPTVRLEGPLQSPDVCAMGCTMIHRRVFEHPAMDPFNNQRWFQEIPSTMGRFTTTEDVFLTQKTTALGFRIAVTEARCKHWKGNFVGDSAGDQSLKAGSS